MSGICDTCKRNQDCRKPMEGMNSCRLYISGKESNYTKLFGTPERAARTLEDMELESVNWCRNETGDFNICKVCPYEYDSYKCHLPDDFSLLDWLKGGAE